MSKWIPKKNRDEVAERIAKIRSLRNKLKPEDVDTVEPLRHIEGEDVIAYLWGSNNRETSSTGNIDATTVGGDVNTVVDD